MEGGKTRKANVDIIHLFKNMKFFNFLLDIREINDMIERMKNIIKKQNKQARKTRDYKQARKGQGLPTRETGKAIMCLHTPAPCGFFRERKM